MVCDLKQTKWIRTKGDTFLGLGQYKKALESYIDAFEKLHEKSDIYDENSALELKLLLRGISTCIEKLDGDRDRERKCTCLSNLMFSASYCRHQLSKVTVCFCLVKMIFLFV